MNGKNLETKYDIPNGIGTPKAEQVLKRNTNEDIEVFGDEEFNTRRAELDGMRETGYDVVLTDRGKHSGLSFDFMYGDKSEKMHGGLMRLIEAGIFEDYTKEGFTREDANNLYKKMLEIEKRNKGKDGYIIKGQTKHFDGRMRLGDARHYTYDEYLELAEAAGYRLKDPAALQEVIEDEVTPEEEVVVPNDDKPEAPAVPEKSEVETDNGIYVVEWETQTIDGNGTVKGKITAPDGNIYNVSYNVVASADGEPDEGDIVAEFEKETQVDDQGNEKVINNTLNITVNGEKASRLTEEQIVQLFEKASAATDKAAEEHDRLLNKAPVPNQQELKAAQDALLDEAPASEVTESKPTIVETAKSEPPIVETAKSETVAVADVDDESDISDQEWLDATLREFSDRGPSIDTTRELRDIETDISRQIYNLEQQATVQKCTGFLGLGGKKTVKREFTAEEQKKYDELKEDQKLMNTLITYSAGMSHDQLVEVDPNDPTKQQQYQRVEVLDKDGNKSYRFAPSASKHGFDRQLESDGKNGTVSPNLVFYGATVAEIDGKLTFMIDEQNVLTSDQVQSYSR